MDLKEAIDCIPMLHSTNSDSMALLIQFTKLNLHKKGKHLFFDKDENREVCFLVKGKAALYKTSGTDEKKVIFVCGAGSILNEEICDGKPSSVNCELITDAYVLSIDRMKLLEICSRDFELTTAIMSAMALKIRRMYRQMKNTVSSVYADRRIAAKLWKLTKDYGVDCDDGIKIDFPLTVTYLAELIGARRETVSRQLSLLADLGLIIIDKDRFIVPDREKLKKYFYKS